MFSIRLLPLRKELSCIVFSYGSFLKLRLMLTYYSDYLIIFWRLLAVTALAFITKLNFWLSDREGFLVALLIMLNEGVTVRVASVAAVNPVSNSLSDCFRNGF